MEEPSQETSGGPAPGDDAGFFSNLFSGGSGVQGPGDAPPAPVSTSGDNTGKSGFIFQ